MKKLLVLTAVVTGLFLFGCSDLVTNNSTQPTTPSKQLVKLPAKTGLSKASDLSVDKDINGEHGGFLVLHGSYIDANGNDIKTFASLLIPKDAFDGTRNISIATDDEYAGLDFAPHMNFNKPLTLNLTFSGLDLAALGLSYDNVGFYYVDDNGNLISVPYQVILLNFNAGSITVIGAKIDHFSRYAFGK